MAGGWKAWRREKRFWRLRSDLEQLRLLQQEFYQQKGNVSSDGYGGDGDTTSPDASEDLDEKSGFRTDAYYSETEADTVSTESDKENLDDNEEEEGNDQSQEDSIEEDAEDNEHQEGIDYDDVANAFLPMINSLSWLRDEMCQVKGIPSNEAEVLKTNAERKMKNGFYMSGKLSTIQETKFPPEYFLLFLISSCQ